MSKDSTQTLTWNAYPSYPGNISAASWNWGDGSSSSGFYPSHTYSAAGVYTVCLSASVTCGNNTVTCVSSSIYKPAAGGEGGGMIVLNVVDLATVGLKNNNKTVIRIFPNPTTGLLHLQLPSGEQVSVVVCDVSGKTVFKSELSASGELDLSTLENGIYFIKASNSASEWNHRVVLSKYQ
jgi:PKD repeat protein